MEVWILYCYLAAVFSCVDRRERGGKYRAIVVCIYIAVETVGGIKKNLPFFFLFDALPDK
jgi:hypothetical protein